MFGNSIKNGCRNLYLNPKYFQIKLISDVNLPSWPCIFVNLLFPNIKIQTYKNNLKFTCCFEKSRKNSSSNLYFHPDTFDLIYKFFLICCHFLLVAQYIRQHQLLAISVSQKQCQIYLLLRKSTKSNCNNLYLKNKPFKINLKTNSYLTSFFCSDSVNPSILTFLNISLTKAVR